MLGPFRLLFSSTNACNRIYNDLVHDGGLLLNRFKIFKYDGSVVYEKKYDKLYQVCYALRYGLGHLITVKLILYFDTFNAYSFLSETPKPKTLVLTVFVLVCVVG